MSAKHYKIVQKIVKEESINSNVSSICLFGSMADGTERSNSDIDIDIICNESKGKDWVLIKKEIEGIKVDCAIISKRFIQNLVNQYPFLSWGIWKFKVIYDRDGFIERINRQLQKYFYKNPEVNEFWEKEYNLMKENKRKGNTPKSFIKVCDEAEIKFSNYHSIRRHIFTKKFFKENIKIF